MKTQPKLSAIRSGDRLTDFEFWECVPRRAVRVVQKDRLGLYVKCREGHHYLDRQEGDDGELCGCELIGAAS